MLVGFFAAARSTLFKNGSIQKTFRYGSIDSEVDVEAARLVKKQPFVALTKEITTQLTNNHRSR